MRILITGSRSWKFDKAPIIHKAIDACIKKYGENLHIIHGACQGVDALAHGYALAKEIISTAVPAKWTKYGNSAGPKRNEFMLRFGKPSLILAFHDDIKAKSKGTLGMVHLGEEAGVPTIVIPSLEFVEHELELELP